MKCLTINMRFCVSCNFSGYFIKLINSLQTYNHFLFTSTDLMEESRDYSNLHQGVELFGEQIYIVACQGGGVSSKNHLD